jgi:pimeloyl-ACP methyl ester carboxylesterase
MTSIEHVEYPTEQALWFGPAERPLVGWLTTPPGELTRGGVILAPPIGQEAFSARRALRQLAASLAARGFVALRFDYEGTGDSSGDFDESDRDRAWVNSIEEATNFLRSLGLVSISAIGMRLGATLTGVAAIERDLHFKSIVFWDPCESGRSYLRELSALEALRREDFQIDQDGAVESSEFFFTKQAASDLRKLNLANAGSGSFAERVLVVARQDRVIPEKLRARLNEENVDWRETTQQEALLDVESYFAMMPTETIDTISAWLIAPSTSCTTFLAPEVATSAVVAHEPGKLSVQEHFVRLGPRQLFAVVSEPVGESRGPLIVFMNSVMEDHTGRARLWVELPRRWAAQGLRCVRLDLSGFAGSSWPLNEPDRPMFDRDWLDDVPTVVQNLNPQDPSNAVLIGLCSGAYVAVESAFSLGARGACVINPPVAIDFLHGADHLASSRRALFRAMAVRLKRLAVNHQWVAATLAHASLAILPSSRFADALSKLSNKGTDLLVFASADDFSPRPRTPFFRSIDIRRLGKSKNYHLEIVPGLDHGMHNAASRAQTVSILERHVLEHFAGDSPLTGLRTPSTND